MAANAEGRVLFILDDGTALAVMCREVARYSHSVDGRLWLGAMVDAQAPSGGYQGFINDFAVDVIDYAY